jgi:hypothetical protein
MSDSSFVHRRLSAGVIFSRYVLFALLCSVLNLSVQETVTRIAPAFPIAVSILAGTAVGFIAKYILDKYWIFMDPVESRGKEFAKVAGYGLFGIATTLLFWLVELTFWYAWKTTAAKYIGAALGLSLGNWAKYLLDRRYIFRGTAQ